jgi:DNA-binding Xre family transcriptional regulator
LVYFIRAKRFELIKIGHAKDVLKRAGFVRCEVRSNLVILATMDGGRETEMACHRKFAHLRVRGEWFRPAAELLDYIEHHATPWDGPEAVGRDKPDGYWERGERPSWKEKDSCTPVGPVLERNLFRLGKADIVVRSTEIAKDVTASTGIPMSRQRISALMNAVHIEPETIEMIAKALKVKPSELLKDVTIEVK